jgi:ABC-type transporter Mla subunit MlaD
VTKTADTTAGGIVRVTAKVTDRWGNPVSSVPVSLALTGAGRLLGAETAAGTTDSAGSYQWNVTTNAGEIGDAVITVSTTGAAGQTLDIADRISNGGTTYVVAGVTAGNEKQSVTATFSKDTATSTADALLALATALGTRDQASAAVDAAAEATDAANAATDAANAAAEAADAATAAAQDAADAVAALSTQVSEMVAALKKQITSLTNLVIKIQKKVKA